MTLSNLEIGLIVACSILAVQIVLLAVVCVRRKLWIKKNRPNWKTLGKAFWKALWKAPEHDSLQTAKQSPLLLETEAPKIASHVKNTSSSIEGALPQPEDDRSLGGEMSNLCTLINNHVQSYYHKDATHTKIRHIDQGILIVAGRKMPVPTSDLVLLLSNPKTRYYALRLCLSWVIMSRLEPKCEAKSTFLPPELAECFHGISTSVGEGPTTFFALWSKWRVISGELLRGRYGERSDPGRDSRSMNIEKTLELLDSLLRHFGHEGRDDSKRRNNLEVIMHRAARFGFLLYRQPSGWEFSWDDAATTRNSFVIFPGLLQVADETGLPTSRPRFLREPEFTPEIAYSG